MKRIRNKVVAIGLIFVMFVPSFPLGWGEEDFSTQISMVVGDIKIIPVNYPTRISVRDPQIADIAESSDNQIVVSAKAEGETLLRIWDREGEHDYRLVVWGKDIKELKRRLQNIIRKNLGIKGIIFKENSLSHKLTVLGRVSSQQREKIEKILLPFKDKIEDLLVTEKEKRMVEIDVRILELNKNDVDNLGIKWPEYLQFTEEPWREKSSSVPTSLNRVSKLSAIFAVHSASRDALMTRINMLVRRGKGRELSRPKLLCLSGEEAKLTVGGEVPYLSASTTTSVGVTYSIDYRPYGVILSMRPIVTSSGRIYIGLRAEVSDLDWDNGIQVSGITVPAFTTRVAETVLNLKSGDVVFLAGLLKNQDSRTIDKLPALGNLPIIGALFRSKEFQNNQTELVISICPRVINPDQESTIQATSSLSSQSAIKKVVVGEEVTARQQSLNEYILGIQRKISRAVGYPEIARQAGWEGTVKLRLHILSNGKLVSATVIQSSGYKTFDQNAVATAKSLSPYPPFPPTVESDDIWIDIPVVYRLD